jgi:flagellar biosynthesis anti-sigma factor FlgM
MEIERVGQHGQPPISAEHVSQNAAVQQAARLLRENAARTESPQSPPPTDSVEISPQARDLARAQEAVEAAPDVRADRVDELRRQIEGGTYHVPAETLAQKLLGGE